MLPLRIALRYLFARKSHNAVNVISIVAIAGVAVATLATVCVLSVFNGFSSLALGRLSMIDPELKAVAPDGRPAEGVDSLVAAVAGIAGVEAAVPVLEAQALAIYGNSQLPINIIGVGEGFEDVSAIDSAIIDGVFALADDYGYPAMALSVGAAIDLGVHPDPFNPVAVYAPRRVGRISQASAMNAFRADSLLVAGVWQVEQSDYDAATAILPLDRVRRLLDFPAGYATAIDIALRPGADTESLRRTITRTLPDGWQILTRAEQETESFRMIAVEKWITFLMLAFILIIASFNVVSTLSMLIIEKRDNLRTLRALGASPAMTSAIFFWEGWLISLVGGIAGIILGIILCLAQQHFGFIHLHGDPSQLSLTAYPVEVAATDIIITLILVAAVGSLVGLISGRLARR